MTKPQNPNKKHRKLNKARARLAARLDAYDKMKGKSPAGSLHHKPGSLKK